MKKMNIEERRKKTYQMVDEINEDIKLLREEKATILKRLLCKSCKKILKEYEEYHEKKILQKR